MESTNEAVTRIKQAFADLPGDAAKALLNEVSASTPFGMAIHQNDGADIKEFFSELAPDDMAIAAERIMEASYALGSTLEHYPHLPSLLEIINASASATSDEEGFFTMLKTVVPAIPGISTSGEPKAFHDLYKQTAEVPLDSVMSQAREAIDDPNTSEEDRAHWLQQVYAQHPELRNQEHLTGADIPLDDLETTAGLHADQWNREVGASAGKVLQSLGFSNRSGMDADDGQMTLEKAIAMNEDDGVPMDSEVIGDSEVNA